MLALWALLSAEGVSPRTIVLSVVGTNDLHGRVEALPPLGGYLANLRRVRRGDGGVVLVDAGDMFQGTLASNLGEGAAVVRAYGALGYAAAAIGNHEFDFGPVGPRATPRGAGDDPRGALKARAGEARFPLLAANLFDAATKTRVRWRNVPASTTVTIRDVTVGLIGVTTMGTPRTTIAVNFQGLEVAPLAATIAAEARALRDRGADAVIVAAHAGGGCQRLEDPGDVSSCDAHGEIFQVAHALPPGAVDVIVAGHTHDAIAHRVAGIPIIESYAEGRAFGRVDLTFVVPGAGAGGRPALRGARIHRPQAICAADRCATTVYEGAPVVADRTVAASIAPALSRARRRRDERLGPMVSAPITRDRRHESPLGNLFADLMRAAEPRADVAITNGGGLRADIPTGPLTYGRLFEAFPFDNRLSLVAMTGGALQKVMRHNLARAGAIVSISGLRVAARCDGATLAVDLFREPSGAPIAPNERLTVVTSDFLATGGDGLLPDEIQLTASIGDVLIREAMADLLRARGGALGGDQARLLDATRPRIAYPAPRPVRCAAAP